MMNEFDIIYTSFYKPVCRYIDKRVKDHALSEDLTQETFIKVFAALKSVDKDRGLSPWIFRIAHNTCVDYYRKKTVRYTSLDDAVHYADGACDPEGYLLNREACGRIQETLANIGRRYRTVLILRHFKSLAYVEIASLLGLDASNVKTLIYRARRQFQKNYIEACCPGEKAPPVANGKSVL